MISLTNVSFGYRPGPFQLKVADLAIARGERVAIIGASGSGKTTLISLLAGILPTDTGEVVVDDVPLHEYKEAERRRFRISRVGFIFQEFELMDYLRVRENILFPFYVNLSLRRDDEASKRAAGLAAELGLEDKLHRYPRELSQGERQRVAICRALVTRPALLIADEPTGNLDPDTTAAILRYVFDRVDQDGNTFIMVTHDYSLLAQFDRVIDMNDLRIGKEDS